MAKSYYENPADGPEESKSPLPGGIERKSKPERAFSASPLLREALEAVENMPKKTIH